MFMRWIDLKTGGKQEIYKETTHFTGIDDLPQIVDFPQKNRGQKSGNVIKSMIAKVKE